MNKYVIPIFVTVILGFLSESFAEEVAEVQANDTPAVQAEEMLDLDEQDDTKIEIQPLELKMSDNERQQENSSSVDFVEKVDKLTDLPCNDQKLREQVETFIYQKISNRKSTSAVEKRERVLMVRNLSDFKEITQEDIEKKDGFNVQAALMNLKINQNKEVLHICSGLGNQYNKFQRIYLIIYPFANFYKVVVANLIDNVDDIEPATFVYNW